MYGARRSSGSLPNFCGHTVCGHHMFLPISPHIPYEPSIVCEFYLESLPVIIGKLRTLPAGKFTAQQLHCWNSDKSLPPPQFMALKIRDKCEQLNILHTVLRPRGGYIMESVYFDWHFSFFFSSRHYYCKWYLCSIWICYSKNSSDIWIIIF